MPLYFLNLDHIFRISKHTEGKEISVFIAFILQSHLHIYIQKKEYIIKIVISWATS